MAVWTAESMPDLTGRVAVVTGANSGIGWEAALELARHGAQTIMACRDAGRGQTAAERIKTAHPNAHVEVMPLDLASLTSIRAFAQQVSQSHPRVDLLLNNAGVMALPTRCETADGFEMQFGTNHLGHFALTGLLLDLLCASGSARVVTVSSITHWMGHLNLSDLNSAQKYSPVAAYSQSKLANMLFMSELQRRLVRASLPVISVACHPGYAATNLTLVAPRMQQSSFAEGVVTLGNRLVAQSAAGGALPTLYAATAAEVRGGEYFGPRVFGTWGAPSRARISAAARDESLARALWDRSVELTGVSDARLLRAA